MKKQFGLLSTLVLSIALSACGGGGGSTNATNNSANNGGNTNNNSGNNANTTKTFSEKATWTVDTSKPAVVCYDFDSKAEVGCETATWDLKFDNTSGRTPNFWTNSGQSGSGKGGALGLFDWSELKTYTTATTEPKSKQDITMRYMIDSASGIFSKSSWYEYNPQNHVLAPNNRVYLITTDSTNVSTVSSVQMPIFAVQVINYYDKTRTSGYPTLRWIDTAIPNDVKEKTFDASSKTDWLYINLKTGETVNKDGDWHIALNRFNIQLNGGVSGNGKVAGFLAKTPAGYYDNDGKAIAEKFQQDNRQESLNDLKDIASYNLPKSAQQWVSDSKSSPLNPAHTGNFPNILDFGWYTYNPNGHKISAKSEDLAKGALLRSGEGDSYARMRVSEIKYTNESDRLPTSWTIEFDIQPK